MRPDTLDTVRPADALEERCTDLGNARRLVRLAGADLRYIHERACWLIYDGTHWAEDRTGEVERRAKAVVESIAIEAAMETDEDRRRLLLKHALASESAKAIRAMVALAQSELGVAATLDAFDRDPWLLNVQNGTIDLRTATLRPHRREDLLSKIIPVDFDPDATCPTFHQFLETIFANKRTLIEYVWRAIGYSLTGLTTEQKLWLCFGVGANGKTTLMQLIARLLSGYSASLAAETLLARKGDAALAMNDLATVQGARFVTVVESDMGRKLAEALVKTVTGGETLKVKRLYADVYSITPVFKLWLASNHRPVVRGTDHAIWRRIQLIPFEHVVAECDQDPMLLDKLEAERPGILTWAVAGCLAWQQEGLGAPDEVRKATAAYREDMDTLADYLGEKCVLEAGATVGSADLYAAYREWAGQSGEHVVSQKAFSMQLEERGIAKKTTKTGKRFIGLRLRTPLESVEGDGV